VPDLADHSQLFSSR